MDFQVGKECVRYRDLEEGKIRAEVLFPEKDGVVTIVHTMVAPELRGMGIANEILRKTVRVLSSRGVKADVTCEYAKRWFEKNPEFSNVLR